MEYMTTKDAEKKWGISERRIRKLISDGRVFGAKKIGNSWNIPINQSKPIDRRQTNHDNFVINLSESDFNEVDELKRILDFKRPIPPNTLLSMKDSFDLEWTYNSNAIEGNTLTLRETQIVLEGITIGGKTIKEHLEAINHHQAINYLEELLTYDKPINEWNIKCIHELILKGIDNKHGGKYRNSNVLIKGAKHIPPDYIKVPELMEKLIIDYNSWNKYHPIIKACLLHGELVKIHPFIDGNGRTSRLIMNLDLINSGYNPIIIKKEDRLKYYEALDKAHVTLDYTDFVKLVIDLEKESLNSYLEII